MGKGIRSKVLKNLPDDVRYLAHLASGENPGYIYFLVSDELGLVKIGASNRWTDDNKVAVDKRIKEIKNDVPFIKISQEHVILAGPLGYSESDIHDHFADYRVGGEWFIYSDDLKLFVDKIGTCLQQQDAWGNDGVMPTEKPWTYLEAEPKPPSKKFFGVQPIFK